ncbi:hypothetical protein I5S53_26385 [Pseudomonas juntendi]|uniref:hypothetical protein n=1 Tax=Pseudomonas TaxID=286 RepID=UPI000D92A561|nr:MULTISPECIES: hypothetical protein [Pseudomonas]MBH3387474.1 hypothetical protein [Pseudomonas juntendi]PYB95893.1 hypothetical protein DMX12_20870 [Pseudomonas sp. MB-090624]
MLNLVPDPPHTYHSLVDTLIQAAEYALCAQTVAQQAVLLQPKSPGSVLVPFRPPVRLVDFTETA